MLITENSWTYFGEIPRGLLFFVLLGRCDTKFLVGAGVGIRMWRGVGIPFMDHTQFRRAVCTIIAIVTRPPSAHVAAWVETRPVGSRNFASQVGAICMCLMTLLIGVTFAHRRNKRSSGKQMPIGETDVHRRNNCSPTKQMLIGETNVRQRNKRSSAKQMFIGETNAQR